jgi:hypothetical protein
VPKEEGGSEVRMLWTHAAHLTEKGTCSTDGGKSGKTRKVALRIITTMLRNKELCHERNNIRCASTGVMYTGMEEPAS